MYRIFKSKKISILMCFLLVICIVMPVSGSDSVPLKERYNSSSEDRAPDEYSLRLEYPYYSTILEGYEDKGYGPAKCGSLTRDGVSVKLAGDASVSIQSDVGGKRDPVFLWEKYAAWAEWEFDVAVPGLYRIEVEYYMLPGSGNPAVRSLYIDGKIPFHESNNISFPRFWKDDGEAVVNSLGDEVRPKQTEIQGWRKITLTDAAGFYAMPFSFYLEPGMHTVRMEYIDQPMAIGSVSLVPAEEIPSYSDVMKQYLEKGYKEASASIEFEAETNAVEKSDPTIRRESNGDPMSRPVSYTTRKLNVLGGYRWRRGNQSITWEFSVPEDGLYKIGMRELQAWNDGLPSYRQVALDGNVPFKELEEYRFVYDNNWRLETLKDENGKPYLFYLSKGRHTLTMTTKMGPLTHIIQSLNDDTILLSSMIRDIIKVTGSNPDPNYEYEFFTTIPTLKGNMEALMASLQEKHDKVRAMSDSLPAIASNFLTIKSQLSDMIKDPYSIAARMNDLNSAQTSLGAWYLSLQSQPLLVDYFNVAGPEEEWKNIRSNIFQRIKFALTNLIVSFKKDYDNVGSILSEDAQIKSTIDVWIARGTEWAELIKEMADEQFTPKTGIRVNINILPSSQLHSGNVNAIMLSIASGRAPDVAMGVDSGSPVEFAIRDAVLDISQFDDFAEVENNFLQNILIPYKYRGGVYAFPETMDFNVLFYRKDVVEELGLKIPQTREELYSTVLPALYQNGLQFYYPQDFTQFIFQHGGNYYTSDGMRSTLDTPIAFQAFKEYTEIFTQYGIPVTASFFNRMRSGEMPMGIGGYSMYMQLSVAAPELAGRWGIAPLPGIKKPNGEIDRSNGALAGQCDIILKKTQYPKESWEFLKWWNSTPVQTQFARELEALIGVEARWNTANVEAFTNLAWKREDLRVIQDQWKWARETPVVLGGYYTGRYVNNAWNTVVVSGGNVRDALENAVKEINRELRMKQEEYNIFGSQK